MAAPLLVFDFDGVLVDGMAEYWWSARGAALQLRPQCQLPAEAPPAFRLLRPLIHKGWEMVLAALELSRPELDLQGYLGDYAGHTQAALGRWGLEPQALQGCLEQLRREAIQRDPGGWLALHRPYPGVIERLTALAAEGSNWLVLTTKGGAFARQLLEAYGLKPLEVYGHEQGSKPEVLLRLRAEQAHPLWFVEDRRPTLETVRQTSGLEAVRCFLVAWGYLGPGDAEQLPAGIHLLEASRFERPLADWP
jgi:phosphoglycolate phosphatase-like HAD superfamily hydrolase